ncbi:hypothetical protein VCR4J2_280019 [Vibrio coralliirubri]|nr:hypothetical protein VCR4J2_280019 [Vibrio coralliirubri]
MSLTNLTTNVERNIAISLSPVYEMKKNARLGMHNASSTATTAIVRNQYKPFWGS